MLFEYHVCAKAKGKKLRKWKLQAERSVLLDHVLKHIQTSKQLNKEIADKENAVISRIGLTHCEEAIESKSEKESWVVPDQE